MSEENNSPKPKDVDIQLKTAELKLTAYPPTVWISSTFAPSWYGDALNEAQHGEDYHSRRREILFAVCCVESYLFEWVRDEALNRRYSELPKYFPYGDRRGIIERWKNVIKEIHADKLINDLPEFGKSSWDNFRTLVNYRDGLVHAKSSRPHSSSLEENQGPLPSKDDLEELEAGWALRIITQLLEDLHDAVSSSKPEWLSDI